jgi:homoserine kinase
MSRGALGCSISGAGPTMFAWAEEVKADEVRAGMVEAFRAEGITSDAWITQIEPAGAKIVVEP